MVLAVGFVLMLLQHFESKLTALGIPISKCEIEAAAILSPLVSGLGPDMGPHGLGQAYDLCQPVGQFAFCLEKQHNHFFASSEKLMTLGPRARLGSRVPPDK